MKAIFRRSIIIFTMMLASCVQETHLKTITFKVDMNGAAKVSQVGIRGEFTNNPWSETIPLTDENNDGIYEVTLSQKTAQRTVEFKFMNSNEFELKDKNNRTIQFEYKPETIIYEAVFNHQNGKQTINN